MTKRPSRRLPPLYDVVEWWLREERLDRFPENKGWFIGHGEPYCFACGWLAPVPDCATLYGLAAERAQGDYRRLRRVESRADSSWCRAAWDGASSYLDRAHLTDRCFGGLDDVQNLVPLCKRCHREMPSFHDGEDALRWVRAREPYECYLDRRLAELVTAYGSLQAVQTYLREDEGRWTSAVTTMS